MKRPSKPKQTRAQRKESYRLRHVKRAATLARRKELDALPARAARIRAMDAEMLRNAHAEIRDLRAQTAGSWTETERDLAKQAAEAHYAGEAKIRAEADSVGTEAQTITAIIRNLADNYDLADVLVAIRDKVQRLADEGPPYAETNQELVATLSGAVRLARRSGWTVTNAVGLGRAMSAAEVAHLERKYALNQALRGSQQIANREASHSAERK